MRKSKNPHRKSTQMRAFHVIICETGFLILVWTLKLPWKKAMAEGSWMAVSKISGRLSWNVGYSDLWRFLDQENNDKVEALFLPLPLYSADFIEDILSNAVVWKIICSGAGLEALRELVFPCDIHLPWMLHFSACRVVDLRNEASKSRRDFFLGAKMKLWNALAEWSKQLPLPSLSGFC